MSTATITRPAPDAITTAGTRCVLCDRLWPKNETPIWHRLVARAAEPVLDCSCDGTHKELRWHGFEIFNSHDVFCGAGLVCPPCIAEKGFRAAVETVLARQMAADTNAN